MAISKVVSKRLLWVVLICSAITAVLISVGVYFFVPWANNFFSTDSGIAQLTVLINSWLEYFSADKYFFYKMIVPAIFILCILSGLFIWLILKAATTGPLNALNFQQEGGVPEKKIKKDFIDHKIEKEKQQRLFLHSLSILQRDGRLLDFFDEDLSEYSDDQIGAAVRSIQEDCKKTVKKYISPAPVIEKEEGEMVIIEKGFDIDSIKLIGNVSGEPPFKGVVKHRGWKAGRSDLPKLNQIRDASVMAPAEVEIQ